MSKPRPIVPLKPIGPSQLWTFEHALLLLKSCQDQYIAEALDEFLINNKSVLSSALPFGATADSQTGEGKPLKDLSLRDVLYTDISTSNNTDARTIARLLDLDFKEVLRTISQTCKRIPERKMLGLGKFKSKLPDDRNKRSEESRIVLYASRILRDRRVILEIVVELWNNKTNPAKSLTVQNLGRELFMSASYLEAVVLTLGSVTTTLIDETYKTGIDALDAVVYDETVLLIIHLMKVVVEATSTSSAPHLVNSWFRLMARTNFMLRLGPFVTFAEQFKMIQALATIVSVLLLDVESNYGAAWEDKVYRQVSAAILQHDNVNSVTMYVWLIILYRKSVAEEQTDLATVNELSQRCSSLDVFADLQSLNELLMFDNLYAAILSQVIISAMPLVTMTAKIASTIQSILCTAPAAIIEKFYRDENVVEAIVLARARFPLQIVQFLRLCSIHGQFALNEFNNLKSYMACFGKREFDAFSEIDDQNTELVRLTRNIDISPPFEYSNKNKLSLLMDTNTKAKVIMAGGADDQVLAVFLYNYNGWALLGRILQNIVKSSNFNNASEISEVVINIAQVLTRVVVQVKDQDLVGLEEVLDVLDSMSAYIDDSDVIEILFRLFEQSLHSRNTAVLIALVNLFTSLVPLIGVKIWSYLNKSVLFESNGKEGFAATIFGAIEMINGEYSFSIALMKLSKVLIEDCLQETKVDNQVAFITASNLAHKSKNAFLMKIITHFIVIFESFSHCRFGKAFQKMEAACLMMDMFNEVIECVYSIDEASAPSEKVSGLLAKPAEKILDAFLQASNLNTNTPTRADHPILSIIDSISDHRDFNIYEARDLSGYWFKKWVEASLMFSSLIISVRSQTSMGATISTFEMALFTRLPKIVNAYSLHVTLRLILLDLMTSLTIGVSTTPQSPSLLAHLGRDYSQILLNSLISDLENSFDDYDMKIGLYDFICAVFDGNQEGLSMLLISGRDVYGEVESHGRVNSDSAPATPTKSVLSVMKRSFRDIKYFPNYVSLHLVDAIALAFNLWTTLRATENNLEFVDLLLSRFKQPISTRTPTIEESVSSCYELKLLSKITEVLSLIIFTTMDEKLKQKLVDFFINDESFKVEFLRRFDTIGYNQRIHDDLRVQFEKNLHVSLDKFLSCLVRRNRFGNSTIWNVALMEKMFNGKNNANWLSIREHVKACNANLQYSNAQISVVKAHGALLTAFCKRFGTKLNSDWIFLASQLLFFDVLSENPDTIFKQVYRERIELCFFILYTMSSHVDDMTVLPENVLDIIKFSCSLISSKGAVSHDESGTYKALLRILKLALGMLDNDANIITSNSPLFRDLFVLLISKGSKTLLIDLQNDAYSTRIDRRFVPQNLEEKLESLTLILSIIKVYVALDLPASLQMEMAKIVKLHSTVTDLMNLFSSSHLIRISHHQEGHKRDQMAELVFSQLSLNFIQQLMTIDVIAQTFIEQGLFLVLTGSSISAPIKQGNLSITSTTNTAFYSIWCNGLLPLCLLAFQKLGPQILPEVCMFLGAFAKQVQTCVDRWSKPSSTIEVTTASILETKLILCMYRLLKMANFNEVIKSMGWSTPAYTKNSEVTDMALLPGLETSDKRDEFVENLRNLVKHPKFLTSRIIPSSPDEVRLLNGDGEARDSFSSMVISDITELKDFLEEGSD
ncbi:Nucleoporin [[Candida] zeylanoides]